MTIHQTTPQVEINAYLARKIEIRVKAIIRTLHYIGISCINEARDNGTYQDQTGNLRNSVGYVIVRDGQIVDGSAFDLKEEGWEGKAAAERIIQQQVAKFPHGIVLIVVAGMNYASAVEARNLNVLTSAELLAEQLAPQIMQQIGFAA